MPATFNGLNSYKNDIDRDKKTLTDFMNSIYQSRIKKKFLPIFILLAITGLSSGFTQTLNIDSGLVVYYPFNDSANDESGNGHHGTVYGATKTTDRNGNSDKAYSFDGVNNYIQCNTIPILDSAFTYCAWIKVTRPSGQGINNNFGCFGTSGVGVSTWDFTYNVDHQWFAIYDKTNNVYNYTTAIGNDWRFIVIKYNGISRSIFLDSMFLGTPQNITTPISSLPTDFLRIGSHTNDGSQQFMGSIDDIRLYDRALSDSEIQQVYVLTAIPSYSGTNLNIEIYPNPTNEKVYIKSGKAVQITVYNLTGEQIFTGNSKDYSYVTLQQRGIYMFELKSEKNTIFKKVIVK